MASSKSSNSNRLSGTTLQQGSSSESSSARTSHDGGNDRYGDRILSTVDYTRVPVEESPAGHFEVINRVSKTTGQTVSVHNYGYGKKTTGN